MKGKMGYHLKKFNCLNTPLGFQICRGQLGQQTEAQRG